MILIFFTDALDLSKSYSTRSSRRRMRVGRTAAPFETAAARLIGIRSSANDSMGRRFARRSRAASRVRVENELIPT